MIIISNCIAGLDYRTDYVTVGARKVSKLLKILTATKRVKNKATMCVSWSPTLEVNSMWWFSIFLNLEIGNNYKNNFTLKML